jgi:alpha-beta hydrolase superfamily lysophospholipase
MLDSRPMILPLAVALGLLLGGCTEAVRPAAPAADARLARAHYVAPDGAVLPVRAWLPQSGRPKAVVLALHGFNDYSNAFALPGHYLSERGIAVYAYDQRGFGHAPGRGTWAGQSAYAADVAEFARQLRQRYGTTPLYLLGESMGGAIAIVAASSDPPPDVDGVILSAPAVWARDTMPWYQRAALAIAEAAAPDLELTGSGLKIQASDNIEILRGLGRDPLVIKGTRVRAIAGLADLMDSAQARAGQIKPPVLLLYGGKDQLIPSEPVGLMLKKLPARTGTRVAFYPGGYHMLLRDLHADQVLDDVAAWVKDRGKPLPSGAEQRGMQALRKAGE